MGRYPADIDAARLRSRLAEHDHLVDEATARTCAVALRLHRPLFVEGGAGVGKTSLATALARVLDVPLIRLACYRGMDVARALYSWDIARQLLHLRAVAGLAAGRVDVDEIRDGLHRREFLRPGPLLESLETAPCLLLVDNLDRADEQLEALLLQLLSDYTVTVPEFGTVRADSPPWVVVTAARSREVHDALKRRCHYLWLDRPGFHEQVDIVRSREPDALAALAGRLRRGPREATHDRLDWSRPAALLGGAAGEAEANAAALGALLRQGGRSG